MSKWFLVLGCLFLAFFTSRTTAVVDTITYFDDTSFFLCYFRLMLFLNTATCRDTALCLQTPVTCQYGDFSLRKNTATSQKNYGDFPLRKTPKNQNKQRLPPLLRFHHVSLLGLRLCFCFCFSFGFGFGFSATNSVAATSRTLCPPSVFPAASLPEYDEQSHVLLCRRS